MSTPERLVELNCPFCQTAMWVIDCDFRGVILVGGGGKHLPYEQREYTCKNCKKSGSGFQVLQKSPSEFFLQPHSMYPMSKKDFDHWVEILEQHFSDDPMLPYYCRRWPPIRGEKYRKILRKIMFWKD